MPPVIVIRAPDRARRRRCSAQCDLHLATKSATRVYPSGSTPEPARHKEDRSFRNQRRKVRFTLARRIVAIPALTQSGASSNLGIREPQLSRARSSLIVAAIASVFTIGYVANLLGEDEDWLHELSIDMFPEDRRLWVYGVGEDGVTAFTEDGIENLRRSSSMNEPPAVRRHRSNPPSSPASAVLTAWKHLT